MFALFPGECAGLLFQASESHLILLLPTVNLAMYMVLDQAPNAKKPSSKSVGVAIGLLTFTAVVFRAEVLLLLASLVLHYLYLRFIGLFTVVKVGLVTALVSIGELIAVSLNAYR